MSTYADRFAVDYWLEDPPKWLASTLEGIAAAEAEIARREAPEPAPEPGSEG